MPKEKPSFANHKWSPRLAYVIGLLATDGNLSKDDRHISLRSSDKELLETFKYCLELTNKISQTHNNGYAKKPSFRIQFGNVKFYRWLLKIGLSPIKTYTLGKIKVPDLFFRDFLRGHLDGDGSIFTYTDKYNYYKDRNYVNQRVYVKLISASQKHINWLYEQVTKLSGIKSSLECNINTKSMKAPIWEIKFSKVGSIRLLKWIYYKEGLPALRRKVILAKQILNMVANEQRKKYTKVTF